MKSSVFVTTMKDNHKNNLLDAVRACFDQFGGVNKFVKQNVFIKINATALEPNAITTPELILAIVKGIKNAKLKPKHIFVFDNSAFWMPTRLVFKIDNLSNRLKELGAEPLYLDEQESIVMEFNGIALDKPIPIPKILFDNLIKHKEESAYINVPKLKTHLQTGITACIKNQHGLLYDDEELYNHHLIDEKIIEIYQKFKPDFNIVDATTVINNGAVSFSDNWIIQKNMLLAGLDAVAVDRVGAELIGIPIERIKYLELAEDQDLGTININDFEILPNEKILNDNKIILNDLFEKI